MGADDWVTETNVENYRDNGIVKSNINYDNDSDFADEKPPPDMSYYKETNVRRGRVLNPGGPQRQNIDGMTKAAKDLAETNYLKARKKWNDANLAKKAKLKRMSDLSGAASDSDDNMIVYTGVNTPLLRTMTEVEAEPMIIGQNYKSKKILQLRIAEGGKLVQH